MHQITLHWRYDNDEGHVTFGSGERILIGRRDTCALVMPAEDRRIHREHAEIIWAGDQPQLRSLGTNPIRFPERNLTLREGQISPLNNEDAFQLGKITIHVMVSSGPTKIRMLRCHSCNRLQPYQPEAMCVQCGFALAGADTVYIEEDDTDTDPQG